MSALDGLKDSVGSYWENLSTRERRLVGALAIVLTAFVIFFPVYLLSSGIGNLEEENAEIARTIRRINHSRSRIAAQRAERERVNARYARAAAPHSDMIRDIGARFEELPAPANVQREPDRTVDGFLVKNTRVTFDGTDLRSALLFIEALKNSRRPVSVERIHVRHARGGDRYHFEVGMLTFEREGAEQEGAEASGTAQPRGRSSTRRRAGPPDPGN